MSAVLTAPIDQGGLRYRALVYDPKRELYPYLIKLGIPQSQIIVAHPFDKRSVSWDLAADFREPAQIEELAEMIIPENERANENRFFEDTARIILQDLIESLDKLQPAKWDLRDICEVVLKVDRLKSVLAKTRNGQNSWDTYLAPMESELGDRTAQSILATLNTCVRKFQSLAALWHRAERRFSLDEWHTGSGLLLLGADPRRERTLNRVNQLLLRRVSQLVLGRDDEGPFDLTWFFIDEVREAGKLRGMRKLMTEGRSKGARVVLGFQDIEGLYSLYDDHDAEEMVGLCANRIVLHLDNPKTRKWASDFFGEEEKYMPTKSKGESYGRENSTSEGMQYAITLRANALPIQFHMLPLGNPMDGIQGWFAYPGRRNEFFMNAATAKKAVLWGNPQGSKHPTFIGRPSSQQELVPWEKDDLQAFQISESTAESVAEQNADNCWTFDSGGMLDEN